MAGGAAVKNAGVDPMIGNRSWDYHLYDEKIARYRGTYAMLRTIEPFAEPGLLFTIWMGYSDSLWRNYREKLKVYNEYIQRQYQGIAWMNEDYMLENGLTPAQMAKIMEAELGHPLHYGGELSEYGVPMLSPEEVMEYLMVDDEDLAEEMYRRYAPLLYYTRSPYASYGGTQVVGMIHVFSDFLKGKVRDYDLLSSMGTSYYETLNAKELNDELEDIKRLFPLRK